MKGTVKGRIVYLEPNDFKNQIGATYGNGDNVYWQPEDLSMAVDLQVIVPNRDSCGKDIWKNMNVDIQNTGWTSFFRGTEIKDKEPYLTDSFTDISYQEITQNGAGSREALGIKSIDIQFDSHFYPIVKMRLIDVRGTSLMMPAEYNQSLREKTCQEFFSEVFHFPYPRFALSVKGFYGSRVTFMLAVNDFQSSFNSQTGNFEVEISFIGHMYGLYTDLPMSCLMVAPYMDSSNGTVGKYWEEQTKNGTFTFLDGTAIPTFKEFDMKCKDMAEDFKKAYVGNNDSFPSIEKIGHYRQEKILLEALLEKYNNLIDEVSEKNDCVIADASENGYKLYFNNSKSIELPKSDDFIALYNSYSDLAGNKKIEIPNNFKEDSEEKTLWGKVVSATEPLVIEENDGDDSLYKVLATHSLYECLTKEIINNISRKNYAGKFVYKLAIDNDFKKKAKERIVTLDNEISSLLRESSEEINEISKKIIGFTPSIENMVRMIYAHIDAFMHEYYKLLNTISENANRTRKSSSFKLRNIETDVDSHDGVFTFPPFTGFYQKDVNTGNIVRKYPGEIPEISNFEEVNFIEKIYDAIDGINKATKPREYSNAPSSPKKEWTPLSVLDALEDDNPYKSFTENNNERFTDAILWFIFKRFYAAFISTKDYITHPNKFPIDNEFNNLWDVYKNRLTNISNTELSQIKQDIKEITNSSLPIDSQKNPLVAKIISLFNEKCGSSKKKNKISTISEIAPSDLEITQRGFYLIANNNDSITKMPNSCVVTTETSYKIDKKGRFLSNVYPKGYFTFDEKDKVNVFNGEITEKNRTAWFKDAAQNNENYLFPVLQFVDKSANTPVNRDYFAKFDDEFFNEPSSATFFAAFLGTTDVFNLKKDESSIMRLQKAAALFMGSMISDFKKNRTKKYPINDDGFFTNKKDETKKYPINDDGFFTNKKDEWIRKINGTTVEELSDKDENGGLLKLYNQWNAEGGINKFIELSKLARKDNFKLITNSKDTILGNTEYSAGINYSKKNEYTKEMVKLAASTVTLLNVYYADKLDNSHILLLDIQTFLKKLLAEIENANKPTNNVAETASEGNTDAVANTGEVNYDRAENKSQLYYTLKNLYDKWLACYDQERFKLSSPLEDSEIAFQKNNGEISASRKINEAQCFMYIDTFYNNIGQTFMVNPDTIIEMLESEDSNISVMQFIANMAQKNKLLFVPLPVFTNMYNADTIASIFTPQSLYGNNELSVKSNNSRGIGNTYVFMYTHEASHHTVSTKNGNSTEYKTDALTLFDDTEVPTTLAAYARKEDGYSIPAFGVTFGAQNQMYFKNINVSMANPRETDVTIANRFELASNERNGDSRLAPKTVGQNLFSIYSNRAYECTVDMMGCANIMPLMYFQLNNIPMFRGAYRVYSVRHHIESGSMTTTFSGVRVSKNAIPFETNVINIENLLDKIKNIETKEYDGADISEIKEGGSLEHEKILDKGQNEVIFNVPDAINRLKKGIHITDEEIIMPYQFKNFINTFGNCATCVKQAVNDGFRRSSSLYAKIWDGGYNGYKCREILQKLNFKCIFRETTGHYEGVFEPGDIVCSNSPTRKYGHVAIYDGNNFISDCIQDGSISKYGGAYSDQNKYELYRFMGKIIYPEDYLAIEFETDDDIIVYAANSAYEKKENIKNDIIVRHPSDLNNNCGLYFVAECTNKEKIIGATTIVNLSGGGNITSSECFNRSKDKKTLYIDLCNNNVKTTLGKTVKISINSKKPFSLF